MSAVPTSLGLLRRAAAPLALLALAAPSLVAGQEAPAPGAETLRVVWWPIEPLTFEQDGELTGYGYELLEAMLKEAGLPHRPIRVDSSAELMRAMTSGEADVGASPLARLSELEEELDFTYSILDSGFQIVASVDIAQPRSFLAVLMTTHLLEIVGGAFLVLVLVAHVVWLVERERPEATYHREYLPGVWDAFWWASVTVTTVGYGDTVPRRPLGRLLALVWMFSGLFLLSLFVGEFTTAMTVERLDAGIRRIEDLRGYRVGAVRALDYTEMRERGVDLVLFDATEDLYAAMTRGELDALVHDRAVAAHYVKNEGKARALLADPVLAPTRLAFPVPERSPHLEALDHALLKLRESGAFARIRRRWFSDLE